MRKVVLVDVKPLIKMTLLMIDMMTLRIRTILIMMINMMILGIKTIFIVKLGSSLCFSVDSAKLWGVDCCLFAKSANVNLGTTFVCMFVYLFICLFAGWFTCTLPLTESQVGQPMEQPCWYQ